VGQVPGPHFAGLMREALRVGSVTQQAGGDYQEGSSLPHRAGGRKFQSFVAKEKK
jgi:hypothetical protein